MGAERFEICHLTFNLLDEKCNGLEIFGKEHFAAEELPFSV
jgi:hypothetical protein